MKIVLAVTGVTMSLIFLSCISKQADVPAIIPQPVRIEQKKGVFTLRENAVITFSGGEEAAAVADLLAGMLRRSTGYELKTTVESGGAINLIIDTASSYQPEEYRLVAGRKMITLTAGTAAGLFRGIQTIRQLMPPEVESDTVIRGMKWTVPCVSINDYPRFRWRGMHLDVSRHFFDISFIKRYIDILALHKLNVFHWHLVDDQGWRIEIKKYPLLTGVGAWRVDREDKPWNARPPQKPGEIATYGGYYTQDEIREVVEYAAQRHITVVPEIEMPAHVGSALAAYPEYSCTGGPFTVPPGGVWPITDIYCAGKDETFAFLEDILSEVIDLFPSKYIHIGGDEADKTEWRRCRHCQRRIQNEGLKDEAELQSYFIKRIERFLNSKGRMLIGWDEILEGGLAPEATVMSWQGFEGGIAAAQSGHEVVMTPASYCYFNIYQGDPATEPESFRGLLTLKSVYSFEPVPGELTPEEARYVIGAQGCLWTEYVTDGSTAEYMILPRLTALSEVIWSNPSGRDWENFNTRLAVMMKRFDAMHLNYSRGSYRVEMAASYDAPTGSFIVKLLSEQASPEIRYTTDGSDPTSSSTLYNKPLEIRETTTIRAAIFLNGMRMGKISEKKIILNKATGKKITYNIPYSDKYKGSGDITLVDGIRGGGDFNDGYWQGFEGTDMDLIIDLGHEMKITHVSATFLANTGSWIFLPERVSFSSSSDGATFAPLAEIATDISPEDQGSREKNYSTSFPEIKTRYVRVTARGLITCPPWHPGAGGKAWLFCDEIVVE